LPGVFLATKVKRLAFCVSLIVIIITSGSTFLPLLDGARQAFKRATPTLQGNGNGNELQTRVSAIFWQAGTICRFLLRCDAIPSRFHLPSFPPRPRLTLSSFPPSF
jgi:hypothetical protein